MLKATYIPEEYVQIAAALGLTQQDLEHFPSLRPYIVLDGHRTANRSSSPSVGYAEGAAFSLELTKALMSFGVRDVAFLIHTQRNRKNRERMQNIFNGIRSVGKQFIEQADLHDIRLKYYGENVHTTYEIADLILQAEYATQQNTSATIHFITNYSEHWVIRNYHEIESLPEFNVVARHTKGHVSGAWLPGKLSRANFIYIQNASIVRNWTEKQLHILALFMLKSYLEIYDFIGNKVYRPHEKDLIYVAREEKLVKKEFFIPCNGPAKLIETFDAQGPVFLYMGSRPTNEEKENL